ncbi:prepilin-type N-terminal cleavage/methylation domain-containing protein [Candidatus Uhrbacteria bacterium]|nr:prepilin-type N-terminal cleavage/methylation domain-containing protein [Candidatus Uhrbacteria bacterium]
MVRQKRHDARGFTLIELMIVVAFGFIIGVGYAFISTVIRGNFWFTRDGALACAQFVAPSVTRVVKIDRNVFAASRVFADDPKGRRTEFSLDSDILFNADCTPVGGTSK